MSALADAARDYLQLRNSLGHDLAEHHRELPRLVAFNDFHGAIDPPTGSGGLVNGVPAGGVEYLSTWAKRLKAEGKANGEQVLTVGAGDMVGASPLISAAFHDEPLEP